MDRAETERRIQTISLLLLSAVATASALYWLRPVMVPFVLALFIALGISPLVDLQVRRLRAPRPVAIGTTLLLLVVLAMGVSTVISASVSQLASNSAAYQGQIKQLIGDLAGALPLERFDMTREDLLAQLGSIPVSAIGNVLLGTTNALLELLSKSLLVGVFVIFLLIGGSGAATLSGVWGEIAGRIERYLAAKAILSATTGVLVGGTLALLDIDLAMAFGLFAFLLNFIPSIGSIIATLLPLPVVIASPDVSFGVAVAAIAVPGVIQFTIGSLIEPKVMGDSLDLHPVVILVTLIIWGMLWGIVGMLLATPMTAIMKILFERLELTRPLAELMAGRLASAPP